MSSLRHLPASHHRSEPACEKSERVPLRIDEKIRQSRRRRNMALLIDVAAAVGLPVILGIAPATRH